MASFGSGNRSVILDPAATPVTVGQVQAMSSERVTVSASASKAPSAVTW